MAVFRNVAEETRRRDHDTEWPSGHAGGIPFGFQ